MPIQYWNLLYYLLIHLYYSKLSKSLYLNYLLKIESIFIILKLIVMFQQTNSKFTVFLKDFLFNYIYKSIFLRFFKLIIYLFFNSILFTNTNIIPFFNLFFIISYFSLHLIYSIPIYKYNFTFYSCYFF